MSGIYIKGMEMPSGCEHCYFLLDCGICCMLMAADCKHKAVGEYRWDENERHPDCPLIPVPDHGRLIDADALEDMIEKYKNKYALEAGEKNDFGIMQKAFGLHDAELMLESLPTIIPGEERKDGQEGSVKRISIKGIFDDEDNQHLSVDLLVSRACAICRDFNGAALRNLHIPTACLPYVRDAIDMFAKMPKESITNHAKYLYSMCKNAAQGKAPIPNDKIVEEVGQLECERQNKISHVLERFGLDNKSIATAGEEGSKARRSISLLVERINRIVDKASLDDLDAICNEAIAAMQKMPGAESYTVNMRATVLASQFSIISGHKYPQNA